MTDHEKHGHLEIKINKSARFGYAPGAWRISKRNAAALCQHYCDRGLPRIGYELVLCAESEDRRTRQAYVQNNAGSEFILYDESRLLSITER